MQRSRRIGIMEKVSQEAKQKSEDIYISGRARLPRRFVAGRLAGPVRTWHAPLSHPSTPLSADSRANSSTTPFMLHMLLVMILPARLCHLIAEGAEKQKN